MKRKTVASVVWGSGLVLTTVGFFSHPGDLTGGAIMIGLALITGYNLFLGNQRGHIAHLLLAGCFVVITGLRAVPWQLPPIEIAMAVASVLATAAACMILYRKAFYDDYYAAKKRDHFS